MALLVATIALVASAQAHAQAVLVPPSFEGEIDTTELGELTTDPFGDVYGLSASSPGHLLKFSPDLTPVFDHMIPASDALASDSAGRLLVAGNSELRRYTSSGLVLGEWDATGGEKGGMASDANDHFYLPEPNGGAPVLNEYELVDGEPTAVASTPYVGTPNPGFVPLTFFDTAVDGEGDVYASGFAIGPEARFIHRYGPGLTGAPFQIKSCSAPPTTCGWVNGLDVARMQTINGPANFLVADNFASDTIQVYSTAPSAIAVGSFKIQATPGSLVVPVDFASSDCTGSLYVLLAVFDGPNNTLSGSRIQRYETADPAGGPCPNPPLVTLTGLEKPVYKLVPKRSADGPCIPCAVLKASTPQPGPRLGRRAPSADKPQGKGLTLAFKTQAAGDLTFKLRGPTEAPGRPKPRGGFIYAADAGPNELRFSGVLKEGKPLRPGTYKTKVLDASGQALERFRIRVLER